eukprot:CAMPEP_0206163244 /NCGR_PEP_ID=MMETSP1474-20131121/11290_1 /ASSEMBLY_ACC=CAM_ASM_001110 /TAXON_ID=97495 /ORGANISM="Imantonia sp., Strain RCC918" /LENGTH=75 /DNA_ID=CAMNT_0053565693 /DNA_START=535 /DNA_END=758 /DNA_ORIENTATION=-
MRAAISSSVRLTAGSGSAAEALMVVASGSSSAVPSAALRFMRIALWRTARTSEGISSESRHSSTVRMPLGPFDAR